MAAFSPCPTVQTFLPSPNSTGSSSVQMSIITLSEGSLSTSCTAVRNPSTIQSVDAMDLEEVVLMLAF